MKLQNQKERRIFYLLSLPSGSTLKALPVKSSNATTTQKCVRLFSSITRSSVASVGDTTDIVTKEMYDFTTRVTAILPSVQKELRPSFVLMWKINSSPQKCKSQVSSTTWAQCSAMSVHRQVVCANSTRLVWSAFGSSNPATDVETIAMAAHFLKEIGIQGVKLHLNTLGNPESRAAYRQALIDYLTPLKETLSKDSQRRLEENPLRVLDSKEKEDKVAVENAPSILDFLDAESQAHFDAVRQMLENLGVDYIIDTNMVRGLDYYNHTIFEFITEIEGNDSDSLCGWSLRWLGCLLWWP